MCGEAVVGQIRAAGVGGFDERTGAVGNLLGRTRRQTNGCLSTGACIHVLPGADC